MRDVRFRHALSLAVNRHEINEVIYYGLALDGNNTVLPNSPLYRDGLRDRWATYDPEAAAALLDALGLTERASRGVRLLPARLPAVVVIETAAGNPAPTAGLGHIHSAVDRKSGTEGKGMSVPVD